MNKPLTGPDVRPSRIQRFKDKRIAKDNELSDSDDESTINTSRSSPARRSNLNYSEPTSTSSNLVATSNPPTSTGDNSNSNNIVNIQSNVQPTQMEVETKVEQKSSATTTPTDDYERDNPSLS